MLESTHSFAAYQAELKKKGAVGKSSKEGKLAPVLSEVEEDEGIGAEKGPAADSEDSQEDIAI